jgi:hypothetical protein
MEAKCKFTIGTGVKFAAAGIGRKVWDEGVPAHDFSS